MNQFGFIVLLDDENLRRGDDTPLLHNNIPKKVYLQKIIKSRGTKSCHKSLFYRLSSNNVLDNKWSHTLNLYVWMD